MSKPVVGDHLVNIDMVIYYWLQHQGVIIIKRKNYIHQCPVISAPISLGFNNKIIHLLLSPHAPGSWLHGPVAAPQEP